jgi:uncharacterized damage-inducible protein DinB
MKPENRRVAGQIGRSFSGTAWHGPSVLETLAGVTAAKALQHAGPEVHSIWELVKHMTAWQQATLTTIQGGAYPTMAEEDDWPPVDGTSEAEWQADLDKMKQVSDALVAACREFPEDKLEDLVSGKEFNYYYLLHGLAQHNIYHAGQIAMLKKLTKE